MSARGASGKVAGSFKSERGKAIASKQPRRKRRCRRPHGAGRGGPRKETLPRRAVGVPTSIDVRVLSGFASVFWRELRAQFPRRLSLPRLAGVWCAGRRQARGPYVRKMVISDAVLVDSVPRRRGRCGPAGADGGLGRSNRRGPCSAVQCSNREIHFSYYYPVPGSMNRRTRHRPRGSSIGSLSELTNQPTRSERMIHCLVLSSKKAHSFAMIVLCGLAGEVWSVWYLNNLKVLRSSIRAYVPYAVAEVQLAREAVNCTHCSYAC